MAQGIRTLSRGTYVGYAVGSVGTGLFSTVPGLLLLTFMVRQLQVPAALAGVVILLPRLWDVVTDPLAGSLSDRTRTRWGARRPWLLAGAVTMPVAFALLFQVPRATGTQAALYVLAIYLLGTTTYTVFQVPYVSMLASRCSGWPGSAGARSCRSRWRGSTRSSTRCRRPSGSSCWSPS